LFAVQLRAGIAWDFAFAFESISPKRQFEGIVRGLKLTLVLENGLTELNSFFLIEPILLILEREYLGSAHLLGQ